MNPSHLRVLGFDQSLTRTGWALVEGSRGALPSLHGWFGSKTIADFGAQARGIIIDTAPDFVAFEAPRDWIVGYAKKAAALDVDGPVGMTPNKKQLLLPYIAGVLEGLCLGRGLPYECVPAVTWRSAIMGKGAGRWSKQEAKINAVNTCARLGLKPGNHDVAEAMLIALWGMTCDQVRLMRHQRERAA